MTALDQFGLQEAPNSPYFTLPTTWYHSTARIELGQPAHPLPRKVPKPKPETFKVTEVFGVLKDMADDDQAGFLLLLMKQTDVDWSAACAAAAKARNIAPVSKMQDRFRGIVRKHDFALEDGKKITGGVVFNKQLVGGASTRTSNAATTGGTKKKQAKILKPADKRKVAPGRIKAPTAKKSKKAAQDADPAEASTVPKEGPQTAPEKGPTVAQDGDK